MRFQWLIIWAFVCWQLVYLYAQEVSHCGEEQGRKEDLKSGRVSETDRQFEEWINSSEIRRKQVVIEGTIRLPVVIHVIHNGEQVGTGTNISQAQILSQLQALNLDFSALNPDLANVPEDFRKISGSLPVIFELAATDPDGNPSNGIVRVQGTKTSYLRAEHPLVKALSYWPAEKYINIWVCNITDYYGYTQFPISELPGIENAVTNRLTDGILVNYRTFGSTAFGNFNLIPTLNKGRILTHEMGHYFGLRHIWGDVLDCSGTDYVDDTPKQSSDTMGCPAGPIQDCEGTRMYQNYMDYTADACMGLFTRQQAERMLIVLTNSPRRVTLIPQFQEVLTDIPVLFSPNGDGINDYWIWPDTDAYADCVLVMYDRTGREVYRMKGYDNSWNGRSHSGAQLEEEAYYYEIKCDGRKNISGGVRIVR